MIIDCHGHYTTAPAQHEGWRKMQIDCHGDMARMRGQEGPVISDDEIRESLEKTQLRLQRERGTDLTIFSPRAGGMGHHVGTEEMSRQWSRICNDLIRRVCDLYPDNFAPVCQLPQSPGCPPGNVIPELVRCVEEMGFVGCNLNPDPSGGHWRDPPLTDPWWFPVYEKLVELDVPAMIHVSQSCNPNFHFTGAHYLNADTTAFMQLLTSDLFERFPGLKLIIPHGGGAVPYHWGRYRGIAIDMKRREPKALMGQGLYFDTCVYHQPGMDLLTGVVPVDHVLFASEMHGAVRCADPETGHHFDDTRRYIEANQALSEEDRRKIFHGNALKVFSRLKLRARAA
ncbi:amidohydrolase family protein [Lutibaculum baratangense]|uniref:4-oxalomesaconate hydratase n=1 Tax=Lutibaculum baratangense AMV1 TaxID=631454 RepID=V4RHV3_9HYPH|nr:amidohydrolase family protein [Lutibaculum baratangense]ESR24889.1 4-oxalomesaconate hydratase [Lutibaculum baratangense AMV1]